MNPRTDLHCQDVIRAAKTLGLSNEQGKRAAVVCWTACGGETTWLVYANDGTSTLNKSEGGQLTAHEREVARRSLSCGRQWDEIGRNLDSIGILQQRPSAGWGDPCDLMDVFTAATRFFHGYGGNTGMLGKGDWLTGDAWYVAWEVQQCSYDDRAVYQTAGAGALADIDRLWQKEPPKEWIDMVTKDEFTEGLKEATADLKAKLQVVNSNDSPGMFAVGPGVFIHIPGPEYLEVGRSVGFLSEDTQTTNSRGLDVLKSLVLQPNYDGQPSAIPS